MNDCEMSLLGVFKIFNLSSANWVVFRGRISKLFFNQKVINVNYMFFADPLNETN